MTFICTKTRECRANNFLGMSYGPAYDGIDLTKSIPNRVSGRSHPGVDDLVGDMLVIFQEWQDGMNAALWRLKLIYFDRGINTPRSIYNKWSGDSEEKAKADNRSSNGYKIAGMMGCGPDEILTWTLNDLLDLLHGMLRFEDSTEVFKSDLTNIPVAMYEEAIAYAEKKTAEVPEQSGIKVRSSSMPPGVPGTMPDPVPAPGVAQPTVTGQTVGQSVPAQQIVYVTQPAKPLSQIMLPGTNIPVDAAIGYGGGILTEVVNSNVVTDPHLSAILNIVAVVLVAIGHALHTDGK